MAIFYYNPSPYGIASLKGAQAEAAKLGIQLDAFDANNNPQLQSTQIQDAITTGKYKAFWVWGLDDVALTPIINKAISAGIKVACADYTWGTLAQQNILTASPTCAHDRRPVDRRGVDEPGTAMNAACTKPVGSGHCNIAFLPGLANYPTDTVRDQRDDGVLQGEVELHVHGDAARQVRPDGLAGASPRRSSPRTRTSTCSRRSATRWRQGAMTAMKLVGGYTPGKNIQIIGYGGAKEIVNEVKTGTVYATLGLYPAVESRARHPVPERRAAGEVGAEPGQHHQPGHPSGDHRPGVPERAPELRAGLDARGRMAPRQPRIEDEPDE